MQGGETRTKIIRIKNSVAWGYTAHINIDDMNSGLLAPHSNY